MAAIVDETADRHEATATQRRPSAVVLYLINEIRDLMSRNGDAARRR